MSNLLPAGWMEWAFGGGLSLIFLWSISVAPMRGTTDALDAEDTPAPRAYRN
ncbi:hypothetical protein PQQ51_15265 [Paraburkholderia xenovorans]|uniref:hypothetical protein n=1 Tax=Paraburkholderia xenovorans TaxID=36873 RepID=UPI0038BAFD1A